MIMPYCWPMLTTVTWLTDMMNDNISIYNVLMYVQSHMHTNQNVIYESGDICQV